MLINIKLIIIDEIMNLHSQHFPRVMVEMFKLAQITYFQCIYLFSLIFQDYHNRFHAYCQYISYKKAYDRHYVTNIYGDTILLFIFSLFLIFFDP